MELLPKSCYGDRKALVDGRRVQGRYLVGRRHWCRHQLGDVAVRCLVADFHEGIFIGIQNAATVGGCLAIAQAVHHGRRTALGRHFVDRRHRMAGTDLARIDAIIVEILAVQRAGLVTDQPIFRDLAGG